MEFLSNFLKRDTLEIRVAMLSWYHAKVGIT